MGELFRTLTSRMPIQRSHTGGRQVRTALEQLQVKTVLGIPGVHNSELYAELEQSQTIQPLLVSHELHGAYMADAISRTGDEQIGVLVTVPGAGITHAASGIGEAYLAGIPMLIIATAVRSDLPYHYQLHEIDQQQLLTPITKAYIRVERHQEIIPALLDAYHNCQTEEPGPIAVEIPANLLLHTGPMLRSVIPSKQREQLPAPQTPSADTLPLSPQRDVTVNLAIDMLLDAKRPCIFVGWGARHAYASVIELAERLYAPVATTLQGLSAFPHDHPLHTGMGFGPSATLPSQHAFQKCDCLLAIGTRFSELSSASFSLPVPSKLIHIDINPTVFNKNFPATFTLAGSAETIVPRFVELLRQLNPEAKFRREHPLVRQISKDKALHKRNWLNQINRPNRVNPAFFFSILDDNLPKEAYIITDDGHHTFLTAEHKPIYQPNHFISPTDFNSMGYCIPATIGVKLANPKQVAVGIVGDGAFRMSCMEIATAAKLKLGCIWFVFNDGELSQISHMQQAAYQRTFCTDLPSVDLTRLTQSLNAYPLTIRRNSECITVINSAIKRAEEGQPVVVNVQIDNRRQSQFTKGVLSTQLKRLPLREKTRLISRNLLERVSFQRGVE